MCREQQPSSDIKDMLKLWERVPVDAEKYLPDKAVAAQSTNLSNQNLTSHFMDDVSLSLK